MALAHSKLTAQGQISVPAEVRRRLGVGPGSVLEWDEEGDTIVVRRAGRFSSEDIHRALFPEKAPLPRTIADMKDGSGVVHGHDMRAVDTNVLVRLITRNDDKQAASADRFVGSRAWVSSLALAEATWVLSAVYDRDAAAIATSIDMLLAHQSLTLQDPDVVAAALAVFRARPSLGFSDCLLVEIARKAGHLPVGTFDRNLSRVDGAQKL